MRNRKPSLKSTFFSLLGYVSMAPEVPEPAQRERLRVTMLAMLGESGCESHPDVARHLRFAPDIHGLWYARSELMAALASMRGEAQARQEMAHLTAQFQGLLPRSMTAGSGRAPD